MPRNRVGVGIDSLPAQKHEDEPHIDSSRGLLDGSFSSRQLKSTASAPSLEAAKAQRQKELLRKKKTERRAHAKQRTAEKQQRQDEKKQKRELLAMMDQDFPAVDPPKMLVDTSTSTQSLACLEVEHKEEKTEAKTYDAATSASDSDQFTAQPIEGETRCQVNSGDANSLCFEIPAVADEGVPLHQHTPDDYPPTPELIPKSTKGSPLTKNANAAATTIQKALKKKFKKCKTMFRQSPRVFAEEVIDPPPQLPQEQATEISTTCYDGAIQSEPEGPTIEALGILQYPDSPKELQNPEPVVPPLVLPVKQPGTPPPRPRSSTSSRSSACSSSCSCSSNPDSVSSCSSCSCSCSSSSSSPSSSSASEPERKHRRRSEHSRYTSRTARPSQGRRRKSRRHTGQTSRSHSHISSGPSSTLLPPRSEDDRHYGELHHYMATRIQARIRGVRGRAKAHQRQVELDDELKEEALHELQQEAVVKIQTRARGVLVRKKMPISDTERRRRRRKRNSRSRSPENVEMGVYEDPDEVGKWPQEIDLELLDDWQELNQTSTTLEETVTHTEFLSRGRLRVFCGTWNMHAKKPTDDLRLWIRLNKYHIVAVGSEECVNSIAKSVVFTSKKSWEGQLRKTLGDDYILVSSHALTAIHNIVFVHSSLLSLLGNIQSDAVATGLGNQLGNKGGVGISFTVGATSFAFINCHFEAHQRNVARRNENFHRINHELKLSPTGAISSPTNPSAVAPSPGLNGLGRTSANRFSIPTVGAGAANKRTVSERFDRVFWYGDLNYRINGTRRMVDTLLLRNQHEVLLANDQLQREMEAGRVFAHFREGQLHFRPTYKFDKRSDAYDSSAKQRIPSWTDRVLFLSNDKLHDVELLSYRSQTDFRTSDHRPVCAVFQVNFRSAATSSLSLQSPRPSSSSPDPHDNRATSQACIIQ